MRRKHVMLGLHGDLQPPQEGERVVRALGSRGGNIVEVEYPDGKQTLCMMPAKFNKKLWVKRGGYLLIEESRGEVDPSSKVTGTILQVLYEDQIKGLKKLEGVWPGEFNSSSNGARTAAPDDNIPSCSSSSEDDRVGDEVKRSHASTGSGHSQHQPERASTSGASIDNVAQGVAGIDVGNCPSSSTAAAGGATIAGAATTASSNAAGATGGGSGQGVGCGGVAPDLGDEDEDSEEDDDLPPLFQNTNRKVIYHEVSDSEDEDSDS